MPPYAGWVACHEAGNRDQYIQHAGVVPGAGLGTELVVELERVLPQQLGWGVDAEQAQVGGHGRADIGQVGELAQVQAVDFVRVHERAPFLPTDFRVPTSGARRGR